MVRTGYIFKKIAPPAGLLRPQRPQYDFSMSATFADALSEHDPAASLAQPEADAPHAHRAAARRATLVQAPDESRSGR